MSPHAHSGPHQADHARCGQGRRKFRNAKHCRAPRGGKRWLRSSTPMYSARPAAPEGSRHPRCRLSAHPPHQQRTLPSGSRRGATRRPSHHHASACSPLSLFFFSCTALARNFIFRSLRATLHRVWHVPAAGNGAPSGTAYAHSGSAVPVSHFFPPPRCPLMKFSAAA